MHVALDAPTLCAWPLCAMGMWQEVGTCLTSCSWSAVAEVQVSAGRREHKRQRPSSPCHGCTYEKENGGTSQAISPGWGERGGTPAHHGRRGCLLAPESPSTSPPPTPPTAAPSLGQCCDCKEDKEPGDLCDAGCCEDCCDGASCWPSLRQGIG
jgi:hypothetical protein